MLWNTRRRTLLKSSPLFATVGAAVLGACLLVAAPADAQKRPTAAGQGGGSQNHSGTTVVSFGANPVSLVDGPDVTVTTQTTSATASTTLIDDGKIHVHVATDSDGNLVPSDQAVAWSRIDEAEGGLKPSGGSTSLSVDLQALSLTVNGGLVALNVDCGSTVGFRAHYITGGGQEKVSEHWSDPQDLQIQCATHWPLIGRKFYDANGNGRRDEGEPLLAGWKVRALGDAAMEEPSVPDANYPDANGAYFSVVVATDAAGVFRLDELTVGGTYGVCEIMPGAPAGFRWLATTVRPEHSRGGASWESQIFCPRELYDTEADNDAANALPCIDENGVNLDPGRGPVDFGNVCLGGGNGRTIGFWRNPNGTTVIGQIDGLAVVDGITHRQNATGCVDDQDSAAFKAWLQGAHATNMAYMLSAQLAAMALNLAAGYVDAGALIYAPYLPADLQANGFAVIGTVVAAAQDALVAANCAPVTTAGEQRTRMELIKNALDQGNNNIDWVQPTPDACLQEGAPIYAGDEDCAADDLAAVLAGVDDGIPAE